MARLVDSVIGHREVWQRWLSQMTTGHMPHALALAGANGIGKSRVAWAMAQALLCERENQPCGECPACLRVERRQSEGVLYIEPEKGVIKLDCAEMILQFLNLRRISRARVVLIDGAQHLNPQAANALLKAIEEPPEQTYFILIVNEWAQLLPTLRSRSQLLRFQPLAVEDLPAVEGEPQWMRLAARGSISELESLRSQGGAELRALALRFLSGALRGERQVVAEWIDQTKDREVGLQALHFLQQLLRDWTVLESGEVIHQDIGAQLAELPVRTVATRAELWHKAFGLERDLVAHVDRALVFENFFYQAQAAER